MFPWLFRARRRLARLNIYLISAGAAWFALATPALAHIGITPAEAPPESNVTFAVRVPNEREEPTVRVRVEFPSGLTVSRFQPVPGWSRDVERDPQQRIVAVIWAGGEIAAGEYQDFGFIARTPRETSPLAFRSFQTYQSGDTVEWVNAQGQDRPAAVVEVKAAAASPGTNPSVEGSDAVASRAGGQATSALPNTPTPPASGSDLPLVAAMVSGLVSVIALAVAGIALARSRRARLS